MQQSRIVAAVGLLAVMSLATSALATITPRDSSTFANKYEMNTVADGVDPNSNTAVWNKLVSGNSNSSLSGGILNTDTTLSGSPNSDANFAYWLANNWPGTASAATGWTVEGAIDVTSSVDHTDSLQLATQLVAGANGSTIGSLNVGLAGTYWGEVIGGNATFVPIDTTPNQGQFVVFRIAQDANAAGYEVWRNGVLIGNNLPGYTFSTNSQLYFADGTTGYSGASQFDYVRYDTTGAYAPLVPEPACLSALGLLLLRVRRCWR